ncbi:PfkB family carbohydrate kinase [Candidatus Halobonum tyrrellensis]|uniref:Uncharacterized protein n=1 Tax=Candidatus Halobonum tyrrellensis G22 TaxID=1324957 RepID=V4GXR0_9EURY|nr:PfkB family carbohydrate kinase [Candidatus Halobonum tyrrellensis]ESP89946.1 hypothetical protein K933_00247 [Candidatus Halobonum tyrrellensis G22]
MSRESDGPDGSDAYGRLRDRLTERPAPTLATLPDGSVDRHCTLAGGDGAFDRRAALGRALVDGDPSTFALSVDSVEPGGQAVNAAQQLHALGSDVTCYGHLDHPVFDDLDFETASMGSPASVCAFDFDEGDVMVVDRTDDDWALADLRRVADPGLAGVFDVDAVCWSNWSSAPAMGAAFHELGREELPRVPFVFDPGGLDGVGAEGVEALRDAIASLGSTFDVVYSVNRAELRATAATLPGPPAVDDDARLDAVREATGVTAAVVHATDEAVVATADRRTTVESLDVDRVARHTGGGDHFSGGLAYALANGWAWDVALACGNACAAHYVETADHGSVDDIVSRIERTAP